MGWMRWHVEVLNETVAAGIRALALDIQARFLRLAEHIAVAGLDSLQAPHIKHLEGKLWEMRLTGRDGSPGHSTSPQSVEGWSWFAHS